MYLNKQILLVIFCFTLASCKKKYPDAIALEPIQKISVLSDSTFFGDIADMEFSDGYMYLVDNSPQIFQLSKGLELTGRIDQAGKGPGEFTGISKISLIEDSLFVYDRTQTKILVFDSANNFVREFTPNFTTPTIAVNNRSQIYLSTPSKSKIITVLNKRGEEINAFGEQTVGKQDVNVRRNERLLFINDNKLVAVPKSDPFVKVYNLKGDLLSKKKIDHPLLQKRVSNIEDSYKDINNAGWLTILFKDANVHNNKLYLLIHTHVRPDPEPKYAFVLAYNIGEDGDLTLANAFKLFRTNRENRLYGFRLAALSDHRLMVYDLRGKSLLIFEDERI